MVPSPDPLRQFFHTATNEGALRLVRDIVTDVNGDLVLDFLDFALFQMRLDGSIVTFPVDENGDGLVDCAAVTVAIADAQLRPRLPSLFWLHPTT